MPRTRRGPFACPDLIASNGSKGLYPLDTKAHVRNASSRYNQAKTRMCAGGRTAICKAEKRFGIKGRACRIRS